MWDGFWVHSFKRKTLIISCSFDRIYYRNYDLIFKKVIFFNVPDEWRDTNIYGDELIRLANETEFEENHPGFSTQHKPIFAIDIHFGNDIPVKYTFFIVAEHLYLNKCEAPDNNPIPEYTDPFINDGFPCFANRVLSK